VAAAPASPADQAKSIARDRCASCHGSAGRGDGPNAATLAVKPRDLSAKEWQKSVSDAQIHTVIVKGGAGTGKSVLMPPNPDLESKPEVVDALVKLVRGYGG
jgi:cytochrome c551/c552